MVIKRDSLWLLLAIAEILFIGVDSIGKICEYQHPQTAVCRANFVIKGKILDVNWKPSESSSSSLPSYLMPRYIKVELRKIFKGVKSVGATKYQTILIRFASFDKPQFELGHLYVLSGYSFGTTLYMNSCSWSSKWKDLTIGQHFGISRSFYWIYCNCQITSCQTKTCKDDVRSCIWDPSDEKKRGFLSQDGICMVADGSRCKWKNFSL